MKRIKTAIEIQAQKPVVLCNLVLDPTDPKLPKPQRTAGKKKAIDPTEARRLQRMRDAGGLVDNHAQPGRPARIRMIPVPKAQK